MIWRFALRLPAALLALLAAAATAQDLRLDLPIACTVGQDCFVQNYVDREPGPQARDYTCGHLTYDAHTGTDIRLRDMVAMRQGVAVLAAAAGTVRATREGMPDVDFRTLPADALKGRDCGNGVVITHPGGWETQYCHLRRGSVRVRSGDAVSAGQPIGLVGLSGRSQFPHVHLAVRRNGKVVDPFDGAEQTAACGGERQPLWRDAALANLAYQPTGLLNAGFATAPATEDEVLDGQYRARSLPRDAPVLLFWVNLFGTQPADKERVSLTLPDGQVLAENEGETPGYKASWFRYLGKKRRQGLWPAGVYTGHYTLTRLVDGKPEVIVEATRQVELR